MSHSLFVLSIFYSIVHPATQGQYVPGGRSNSTLAWSITSEEVRKHAPPLEGLSSLLRGLAFLIILFISSTLTFKPSLEDKCSYLGDLPSCKTAVFPLWLHPGELTSLLASLMVHDCLTSVLHLIMFSLFQPLQIKYFFHP